MEKVTIDYNRLCLELEKQGKTKADLSRDMTKNKNFVGLMEKNPDQPAEVERLMCLLLGLEQGSLIKQEEATGSQGEIKILENLHKEMREIHQAIIEYGELSMWLLCGHRRTVRAIARRKGGNPVREV